MSRMPRAFRRAEGAAVSSLLLQEMRGRSDRTRGQGGSTDELSGVPSRRASGGQRPRKVRPVCAYAVADPGILKRGGTTGADPGLTVGGG